MILELIYYFIPAYAANTLPPILARLLPWWQAPLDCGCTFRGRRLLGKNKTLRGALGGILLAGSIFILQQYAALTGVFTPAGIPYQLLPWWTGLLLGAGCLLIGDAGASLIKRQLGIKPGRPWIPFDQLDYVIGALLLTFWLYWPGWVSVLLLALASAAFSLSLHYLGYRLGINKDPY